MIDDECLIYWKSWYRSEILPVGASRLRVERRGKCRVMTKYEEARERPLLKAQRFVAFFWFALEKNKCMKFCSVAEKWILLCGEWLSGFGECRQTTKARRKETKRLWTRTAKNVTNLKPERFSRRAKHKRRQTPNEQKSRKWKAKKPVFWRNALLTYLGFGGMKKPWLMTYEDVTKKTNGKP